MEVQNTTGLKTSLPEKRENQPYLTVVENPLSDETVPVFRIVMLPKVRQQFLDRYLTDEYFPASFYCNDESFYNVEIRHRGRSRVQNGRFKIRFPYDHLYQNNIRRLNFNGTDINWILRESLGFQLFRDAGLPCLDSGIVRFHINGEAAKGTAYRVCIEEPDSQFLSRKQYFSKDNGNIYKTTLDGTPQNKATWRYVGENPDLYRNCYIKQSNEDEDDFSDIIDFCKVLTESRTEEASYVDKVNSVLNTGSFLRWMAVAACVSHWDSPFTDHGHNYILYHHPGDDQFYIMPWDLNGTFTSRGSDKEYTHIRSTKFDAINKNTESSGFWQPILP